MKTPRVVFEKLSDLINYALSPPFIKSESFVVQTLQIAL